MTRNFPAKTIHNHQKKKKSILYFEEKSTLSQRLIGQVDHLTLPTKMLPMKAVLGKSLMTKQKKNLKCKN